MNLFAFFMDIPIIVAAMLMRNLKRSENIFSLRYASFNRILKLLMRGGFSREQALCMLEILRENKSIFLSARNPFVPFSFGGKEFADKDAFSFAFSGSKNEVDVRKSLESSSKSIDHL